VTPEAPWDDNSLSWRGRTWALIAKQVFAVVSAAVLAYANGTALFANDASTNRCTAGNRS
jgi:hypothetical protein